MRRRVVRWMAAFLATAGVVALLAGHSRVRPVGRALGAGQEGTVRPGPTVAVGHPRVVRLPRTLDLSATITSLAEAVLVPKTSGYLVAVTVRPGDEVRPGQVLAVIDHAQLDAEVAQAEAALRAAESGVQTASAALAAAHAQRLTVEAGLAAAEASLRKAQAERADVQASYLRTQSLAHDGAVSQQLLDDAAAQAASAEAGVEVARAQAAQAAAQVRAAREQEAAAAAQVRAGENQVAAEAAALAAARLYRSFATIVAPFSGVVVSRQLDPGAYVTPGTSTPILTLADLDHLDIVVPVGESALGAVHPGDPAVVTVGAYPGRVFRGAVSRIAGGVDPATRTASVEVDLSTPARILRPGMSATVQLTAGVRPAVVVPLSALVTVGSRQYVWEVTGTTVVQRPVTTGQATGDVVEVTSGVGPSDLIVVRGTDFVRAGHPIVPVPTP